MTIYNAPLVIHFWSFFIFGFNHHSLVEIEFRIFALELLNLILFQKMTNELLRKLL